MSKQQEIKKLWDEFEDSILACYNQAQSEAKERTEYVYDPRDCLRDYARDVSWADKLAALLGTETAHERRHRSNRPHPTAAWFTVGIAAKLLIMENARSGAELAAMPEATIFILYRDSAAEATLVGWLARVSLSQKWRDAVKALDYAKLINP